MQWAKEHCLKEHFVYLSLTAGAKIGVTRATQIPTRWIDQGAIQALKFAKTSNRYEAGCIEVQMKNHISDRTAWQRMLKNDIDESVEVLRDDFGINHIYAKNQDDLFFMQGYLSARDRLFQFEIWRIQATGTVSEIFG